MGQFTDFDSKCTTPDDARERPTARAAADSSPGRNCGATRSNWKTRLAARLHVARQVESQDLAATAARGPARRTIVQDHRLVQVRGEPDRKEPASRWRASRGTAMRATFDRKGRHFCCSRDKGLLG